MNYKGWFILQKLVDIWLDSLALALFYLHKRMCSIDVYFIRRSIRSTPLWQNRTRLTTSRSLKTQRTKPHTSTGRSFDSGPNPHTFTGRSLVSGQNFSGQNSTPLQVANMLVDKTQHLYR